MMTTHTSLTCHGSTKSMISKHTRNDHSVKKMTNQRLEFARDNSNILLGVGIYSFKKSYNLAFEEKSYL